MFICKRRLNNFPKPFIVGSAFSVESFKGIQKLFNIKKFQKFFTSKDL